jgi:hypothetical protein
MDRGPEVSLAPFFLSEKPQDSTAAATGFTENAKNISRLGRTAKTACGFGAAIREPDSGRIVLHSLGFCDDLTQKNLDSTASTELPGGCSTRRHHGFPVAANCRDRHNSATYSRERPMVGHRMDAEDGAACQIGMQTLAQFRYLRCSAI